MTEATLRTPFEKRDLCGAAAEDIQFSAKSAPEQAICRILEAVQNKHNWAVKFLNPEIKKRWYDEICAACTSNLLPDFEEISFSAIIEYAFKELEFKAQKKPCLFSAVDNVFASDSIVPETLRLELLKCTAPLENIPEEKKDYHPNSKNQVVNLVHPSLYPLVYGRTLVLPDEKATCSRSDWPKLASETSDSAKELKVKSVKAPQLPPANDSDCDSLEIDLADITSRFQWLPSIFSVSDDGNLVSIDSYINNLKPEQHPELYVALEKIFCSMLPLLECTLTHLVDPIPRRLEVEMSDKWDTFKAPEIPSEYSPHEPKAGYSLKGKKLKVITKLAGIHLTPGNSVYAGGNWHVEGTPNENIVATLLYYYDISNITESKLLFRTAICTPEYAQYDDLGVSKMYGLERGSPLVQNMGAIRALQGRAICFPNIFQHCVAPFALADQASSGHRKILAFFVVDPEKDAGVYATNVVAPQQNDWDVAAGGNTDSENLNQKGKMSLKEALEYRLELMSERSLYTLRNTNQMFHLNFDLCEH